MLKNNNSVRMNLTRTVPSVFIGLVFIVSGIGKLIDFGGSVAQIKSVVPVIAASSVFVVSVAAITLCALELYLGAVFVCGRVNRYCLAITAFLYSVFGFINIVRIFHNPASECGCFGTLLPVNVSSSLLLDALMLLLCAYTANSTNIKHQEAK